MKTRPGRIGSQKIMPQARRLKKALFRLLSSGPSGFPAFATHIQKYTADYTFRQVHDALVGIHPSEFPNRGLLLEHALTHLLWEQVVSEVKLGPREAAVLRSYYLAKSHLGAFRLDKPFDEMTVSERETAYARQKKLEEVLERCRLFVAMHRKKSQILKQAGVIRLRIKNALKRRTQNDQIESFPTRVMNDSLAVFTNSLARIRDVEKLLRRGSYPLAKTQRMRNTSARENP